MFAVFVGAFALFGGEMFVSSGNVRAVVPYATQATAAPDIASAVALAGDGTTIHVAPGLYPIKEQIVLTNAVRVIGDDPDPSCVVVSNTTDASDAVKERRIFYVNHAGALVANLTMKNGSVCGSYVYGGNFQIGSDGGTVSNCVVGPGTRSQSNAYPGGGYLYAGVVTHSVFRQCSTRAGSANWQRNRSGVLELKGSSRAENCLFVDNPQLKAVTLINIRDTSVMRNCTIVDSSLSETNKECASWAPLRIDSGATVENVVVAGVTNTVDGTPCLPVVEVANFRNGAVDGNISGRSFFAGTITGTAQEFFRDYVGGDYRPAPHGPLVNRGADYEGMAAFDLTGLQKRRIGKHVDIGAYEAPSVGTMLSLR